MRRLFTVIALAALGLMIGHRALATGVVDQQYEYRLLLDTDANPDTGCAVPVEDKFIPPTTFDGVEQIVIIKVARNPTTKTATVIGITRRVCAHGVFRNGAARVARDLACGR